MGYPQARWMMENPSYKWMRTGAVSRFLETQQYLEAANIRCVFLMTQPVSHAFPRLSSMSSFRGLGRLGVPDALVLPHWLALTFSLLIFVGAPPRGGPGRWPIGADWGNRFLKISWSLCRKKSVKNILIIAGWWFGT
jgi:hypothetical protein